jgi:SAM-dependent methyltransferase
MPEPHAAENWLEKRDPGAGLVVAVGLERMAQFHHQYPKVLCAQANGRALPFEDGAVDIAIANAVLEHVPPDDHRAFVEELSRVARKWALISVPDRCCPVEVHTRIPLLHWLPFWRTLFRLLGKEYWASPTRLTLFTCSRLYRLLEEATGRHSWRIRRQTLLGLPISLVATLERQQ